MKPQFMFEYLSRKSGTKSVVRLVKGCYVTFPTPVLTVPRPGKVVSAHQLANGPRR